MADDHVIDIRGYLDKASDRAEAGAFGTWGGTGERSRFALPVWRSIYLARGDWGGIVYLPEGVGAEQHPAKDEPRPASEPVVPMGSPFFVLDLQADPARTEASLPDPSGFKGEKPPAIIPTESGGLAIFLGNDSGRWWFLLIQGKDGTAVPEGRDMETMLFLAGECSGLLFLRELAGDVSRPE